MVDIELANETCWKVPSETAKPTSQWLLSLERVRVREVRTELLIEPDKTPSYCHSLLEPCDGGSEELRGEVCLE